MINILKKRVDETMPEVHLDQEKCINCKTCIRTCPMGVYKEESDTVTVAAADECIACMGCVAACPTGAIEVIE
ncbi:MAG: ferredoxin family protein [Candidatus Bathyarchaeota archaeon]|nr:ferredoxin family protein [Candidatus Bathyarchaeota archaeon]